MQEVFYIILVLVNLLNGDNHFIKQIKQISNNANLNMCRFLLYTSNDSISFIYPKELGYQNDYKQVIYKILNKGTGFQFIIKDSVYDNQTNSIYFNVLNINGKGAYVIRLTDIHSLDVVNRSKILSNQTDSFKFDYLIAPNWSKNIIYQNSKSRISALDIDVKKQKLFWLELDSWLTWHFAIKNLNNANNASPKYFQLHRHRISRDLYTYISVQYNYDDDDDIWFFASNRNTLTICFPYVCFDYFEELFLDENLTKKTPFLDELKNIFSSFKSFVLNMFKRSYSQPTKILEIIDENPLYKFNLLRGLFYDKIEHALYISDYNNDRVLKLSFNKNNTLLNKFTSTRIENVLQVGYEQTPIRSMMHVVYGDHIFWINFNEGLQTNTFNSTCSRTIYKDSQPFGLKLVELQISNK